MTERTQVNVSQKEQAERLAAESILRFGFVVVGYKKEAPIGEVTQYLWNRFLMPQPFVVVRRATDLELSRQCDLYIELTGLRLHPEVEYAIPMVLVTD